MKGVKPFEQTLSNLDSKFLGKLKIPGYLMSYYDQNVSAVNKGDRVAMSVESQFENMKKLIMQRQQSEEYQKLKKDISKFKYEGFASKHFETARKKNFFRKKSVTIKELMEFTDTPIKNPLLKNLHGGDRKLALKAFKNLMIYMGDLKKGGSVSSYRVIKKNLALGVSAPRVRDELYFQIFKQVTKNPNPESETMGYVALCLYSVTFPPSLEIEHVIFEEIQKRIKELESDDRVQYLKYAFKNIKALGGRHGIYNVPMDDIIKNMRSIPFAPIMFETSLTEILKWQKDHSEELKKEMVFEEEKDDLYNLVLYPDSLDVPRVVTYLLRMLKKTGAFETVGIFRVPGSLEKVEKLKFEINMGNYDEKVKDPNVYGSALKLWLRELTEPLIPFDIYSDLLKANKSSRNKFFSSGIYKKVPVENLRTLARIIRFFREITQSKYVAETSMGIDNVAMVFAPNIFRERLDAKGAISQNAGVDVSLMKQLISELDIERFL